MSSAQVIDETKLARAEELARADATAEKQSKALADATEKHEAVVNPMDGGIDMTDAVAQAGRPLARSVIEMRLKSLNPSLRFERSVNDPSKNGIYLGSNFISGMEWERSPEFTVKFCCTNDETGREEFAYEIRGWRNVIDGLIRKGFIKAEATYKLFETRKGRESANWSALHH